MKKIAFHIQKGGVGKTTLSGNVAYCMGTQGKKVTLIDCDAQGNLTGWIIPDSIEFKNDISSVLTGACTVEEALVKVSDTLYVIPSFSIGSKLSTTAEVILAQEPYIFDDLCEALEGQGFDIAIFDLSPGMNRLERSIILAMDEAITPVTPEKFSVDGIQIFAFELAKLNKNYKRSVEHKKIVVNAMNKSFKRHILANNQFKALDYEIFEVGQDSKIADAVFANKSIIEYYPESKTIPEIQRLSEALWQ